MPVRIRCLLIALCMLSQGCLAATQLSLACFHGAADLLPQWVHEMPPYLVIHLRKQPMFPVIMVSDMRDQLPALTNYRVIGHNLVILSAAAWVYLRHGKAVAVIHRHCHSKMR